MGHKQRNQFRQKNYGESPLAIHELKSMPSLLTTCTFKSSFPCTAIPFESQCDKDDIRLWKDIAIFSYTGKRPGNNWPSSTSDFGFL